MDEEILLLTSNKDAYGINSIDSRGIGTGISFKSCVAEPGTLCCYGNTQNAFSGVNSSGDYIAVSQANKPLINIYQWGKPQPLFQCHTQEIICSLNSRGSFLFGGTKKGNIYIWVIETGELIATWQAHFNSVKRIDTTENFQFCISVSEDGMGRAWDLSRILDQSDALTKRGSTKSLLPFRSWNNHTLPITDMYVMDTKQSLRVLTCSVDRTVHLYDVYMGKSILRVNLPEPLECITCNPGLDWILVGSSSGAIFLIDFSVLAAGFSASHSNLITRNDRHLFKNLEKQSYQGIDLPLGVHYIRGHQKAVKVLVAMKDNATFLSCSDDGTIKFWNLYSKQIMKEIIPFQSAPITNCKLIPRPEMIDPSLNKTIFPILPLRKYMDNSTTTTQSTSQTAVSYTTGPVYLGYSYFGEEDSASKIPHTVATEANYVLRGKHVENSEETSAEIEEPANVAADTMENRADYPEEDFVAFQGDDNDAEEPPTAENDSNEEIDDDEANGILSFEKKDNSVSKKARIEVTSNQKKQMKKQQDKQKKKRKLDKK